MLVGAILCWRRRGGRPEGRNAGRKRMKRRKRGATGDHRLVGKEGTSCGRTSARSARRLQREAAENKVRSSTRTRKRAARRRSFFAKSLVRLYALMGIEEERTTTPVGPYKVPPRHTRDRTWRGLSVERARRRRARKRVGLRKWDTRCRREEGASDGGRKTTRRRREVGARGCGRKKKCRDPLRSMANKLKNRISLLCTGAKQAFPPLGSLPRCVLWVTILNLLLLPRRAQIWRRKTARSALHALPAAIRQCLGAVSAVACIISLVGTVGWVIFVLTPSLLCTHPALCRLSACARRMSDWRWGTGLSGRAVEALRSFVRGSPDTVGRRPDEKRRDKRTRLPPPISPTATTPKCGKPPISKGARYRERRRRRDLAARPPPGETAATEDGLLRETVIRAGRITEGTLHACRGIICSLGAGIPAVFCTHIFVGPYDKDGIVRELGTAVVCAALGQLVRVACRFPCPRVPAGGGGGSSRRSLLPHTSARLAGAVLWGVTLLGLPGGCQGVVTEGLGAAGLAVVRAVAGATAGVSTATIASASMSFAGGALLGGVMGGQESTSEFAQRRNPARGAPVPSRFLHAPDPKKPKTSVPHPNGTSDGSDTLQLVQINVRGLKLGDDGKYVQLVECIEDHKVDIAAIQETFAGADCEEYNPNVGRPDYAYVTLLDNFDSTTDTNSNPRQGVGFIVRRELLPGISKTRRFSPRIMSIEGSFKGEDLLIFSCYAPCSGKDYTDDERLLYLEDLEEAIKVALHETGERFRGRIILLGDFNAEVGTIQDHEEDQYGDILGQCLRPERTECGEYLLEFCERVHGGMTITNSFFQRDHPATYVGNDGEGQATLDHVIVSHDMWLAGAIIDAGVHPSPFFLKAKDTVDVGYDHRASILVVRLSEDARNRPPPAAELPSAPAKGGGTRRQEGRRMPGHRTFATKEARMTFDACIKGPMERLLEDARESKDMDVSEVYEEMMDLVEKAHRGVLCPPPAIKPDKGDWIDANAVGISALIVEKRRALNAVRSAGRDVTEESTAAFQDARRRLQSELRHMKQSFVERLAKKLLETHAQNRGLFHKVANEQLGPRADRAEGVCEAGILGPPDADKKRHPARNIEEGKAIWTQHWMKELNVRPNVPITIEDVKKYILFEEKAPQFVLDDPVTRKELEDALKKCKGDRSMGGDAMNIGIFKGMESVTQREVLLLLINAVLEGKKPTPSEWKDVIIQSIHKKGARNVCENYRPVSLISHVGKLVERIIQGRLEKLRRGDDDLESDTQWGKSGCSTSDAIILSKSVGTLAVKRGCTVHKCFADLKAAFDSVPRELLFELLKQAGVPPKLLSLISSLHIGSMAQVRWNDGSLSPPFELKCGLKQGAIYSPLLFALYFNFVMAWTKQECRKKNLGVTFCFRPNRPPPPEEELIANLQNPDKSWFTILSLEFADDVELNALSIPDLQEMVKIFGEACKAFGLNISYTKTVVMAVAPPRRASEKAGGGGSAATTAGSEQDGGTGGEQEGGSASLDTSSGEVIYGKIVLDKYVLKRVTSFCYLGQLLNNTGTLSNELAMRRSKMRTTFNRLKGNVLQNWSIPLKMRLQFFNAAVIEGSLYACETWTMTQAETDSMESVLYQLLLRTIYSMKEIRSGRLARKSLLDLVLRAAEAGFKVLPIAVFVQVARLRYYGHIARRAVRETEEGKASVHMFLLDPNLVLAGPTGPGSIQAAKITFASSTKAILVRAHTAEMAKEGLTWEQIARTADKKAFSDLVRGAATETLLEGWVEKRSAEHEARTTKAQEAGEVPDGSETKDIHDKKCHICNKTGTAKRFMCEMCLKVEHLKCVGRAKETIVGDWICQECLRAPFADRAGLEQAQPLDRIKFQRLTGDDIKKQGASIIAAWYRIQRKSDAAKARAAIAAKRKAAEEAEALEKAVRYEAALEKEMAWRASSTHAQREARRGRENVPSFGKEAPRKPKASRRERENLKRQREEEENEQGGGDADSENEDDNSADHAGRRVAADDQMERGRRRDGAGSERYMEKQSEEREEMASGDNMEEESIECADKGGTILTPELDEFLRMYMGGGGGEGGEKGIFDEGAGGGEEAVEGGERGGEESIIGEGDGAGKKKKKRGGSAKRSKCFGKKTGEGGDTGGQESASR